MPPTREPGTDPVPLPVEHTLYASTSGEDAPQARTLVSWENDKKILWTAHESTSILSGGGNYPFLSDNDPLASDVSFTGEGPEDFGRHIAMYPYNASATYSEGYVSTALKNSIINIRNENKSSLFCIPFAGDACLRVLPEGQHRRRRFQT